MDAKSIAIKCQWGYNNKRKKNIDRDIMIRARMIRLLEMIYICGVTDFDS